MCDSLAPSCGKKDAECRRMRRVYVEVTARCKGCGASSKGTRYAVELRHTTTVTMRCMGCGEEVRLEW